MTMLRDVRDFHDKFGLSIDGQPRLLDRKMAQFRVMCLKEEVQEFEDALATSDLPGAFDALIDLVYFALGTAHIMNLPWEAGWNKVQAANMRKVRAERSSDSKRGSGFDVIKPQGWVAPDLSGLVE